MCVEKIRAIGLDVKRGGLDTLEQAPDQDIPYKFRLLNWFRGANFIVSRESTGFASDPEEGKVFRRYTRLG